MCAARMMMMSNEFATLAHARMPLSLRTVLKSGLIVRVLRPPSAVIARHALMDACCNYNSSDRYVYFRGFCVWSSTLWRPFWVRANRTTD